MFRDERTKPDRQPEFTQLDVELSFTDQEKVMKLIEDLVIESWPSDLLAKYGVPSFSKMTFAQAINDYGCDKPDLRFNWKIEASEQLIYLTFPNFEQTKNERFIEECRKFTKTSHL